MNTHLLKNQIDSELGRKIRDRIKWDKRVSAADLDVVVRGNLVIVSGFVDTSYKKNAALEVISDTEGVWAVEDRIVVPTDYYRSDEEILRILETQMADMIKIGGEHVEVEVVDGVVRLQGEVFRPRLKALAVAAAWELSGVLDVLNFIEIKDPPRRVPISVDFAYEVLFPLSKGTVILEDNLKEVS
ncbi:BON domain-containing protein [Bdellovibrio bacteriovorus]|uniref:BON domain-containing protein n=1 Tax=Bdellovibrio bacteriovorus TaxID=959 RepID=UPI0021D0281C|nr:BON domain-containing protein [Bdellovibrio bacteriovorus]UXR64085.1 BON domain-containing protein [Bdellovibrio bacteriovorus]